MSKQETRVTVGVSLMPSLLSAIDEHIGTEERSAYFRRLAQADLSAAGKLPGTPAHNIRELAVAALDAAGDEKTIAALNALIDEGVKTAAEKVA